VGGGGRDRDVVGGGVCAGGGGGGGATGFGGGILGCWYGCVMGVCVCVCVCGLKAPPCVIEEGAGGLKAILFWKGGWCIVEVVGLVACLAVCKCLPIQP